MKAFGIGLAIIILSWALSPALHGAVYFALQLIGVFVLGYGTHRALER